MLHSHGVLTVFCGDKPYCGFPLSGVQESAVFGLVLHPHETTWIDVTSTRGITRVECNVVFVVYNIIKSVVGGALNLQSTKPGHSNGIIRGVNFPDKGCRARPSGVEESHHVISDVEDIG